MNTSIVVIVCCLAVIVVPHADAFCYATRPTVVNVDGSPKVTCEDTEFGIMEPGQTISKNCIECTCSNTLLSCCGQGYNGGVMVVAGCEMKKLENCCYQFFQVDDSTKNCTEKIC